MLLGNKRATGLQTGTEWPYDQTTRRLLECAHCEYDIDDRVLVGVVVVLVVLLVQMSGPANPSLA